MASLRIKAERRGKAFQRLEAACKKLEPVAGKVEIAIPAAVGRDPELAQITLVDSIADYLESVHEKFMKSQEAQKESAKRIKSLEAELAAVKKAAKDANKDSK